MGRSRSGATASVVGTVLAFAMGVAVGLLTPMAHATAFLVAFLVALGAGAAAARLRGAGRRAAFAPRNLLARQLAVSAGEAEISRFRRFARDAPIGIVFVGPDGGIRFANDEYLRIVGLQPGGADGQRFGGGVEDRTRWLRPELGATRQDEYVRADGRRVPVLIALSTQGDGIAAFVVDLSAEKAAQRALQESEERYRTLAARLAEADRRKDEFLGMLSHELRNPLAPIRNSIFTLRRSGGRDPALRERALSIVDRQVEHLTRLVDDLLDVTRITRGKIELRRERVDLGELLARTVEDHRVLAESRGVELRIDGAPARAVVDGDPTRLMQILGNLLQNAVKFSPPGGHVWTSLAVDEGAGRVALRVGDDGPGIEPALLDHLFEPFVQGDRTLARAGGGLGLGLALVKGFTELHGGRVEAASAGPDRGAQFTVSLPLATPEPAPVRPREVAAVGTAHRASRVLVVEDNPDVATSLRDLCAGFGHEVEVAGSGDAALAEARRNPPDVVLCDVGLPGMSGYEVARAFRHDPVLRHARLVAVTGYAQPEDRREAAEAGFDRHVAKPPDPGELERLLAAGAAHPA
jgi:signal transduction histidine kinase/ActR/RegA family two-component response regulator